MKKIIVSVMVLFLLVACGQSDPVDETELQVLKCDYSSETMMYDNILNIKNKRIINSILTIYTETESSEKEVTEALDALFNTSFTYFEQGDYKLLTAVSSVEDLSEESLEYLLLDTIADEKDHSLEDIIEAIENHDNKHGLEVVCTLI